MNSNEDFDWVTARSNCFTRRVFHDLRDEIKSDVEIRNSFLSEAQKKDFIGFKLDVKSVDVFLVHRNGAGVVSRIRFECDAAAIRVLDEIGHKMMEATLTLNDVGACRLMVDKDELSHWQFRRRALQNLFFAF